MTTYNKYVPREIPSSLVHVLYKEVEWKDEYGQSRLGRKDAEVEHAEVVSSQLRHHRELHAPVLDIDMPARLVPSSTEGHYHLYIDCPMTWRQYKRLLQALARAGVLEKGYVKASIRRRHTAVRVPWLKKEK